MLQRIKSYDDIVILATNLGRNIDEGFARRTFDATEFPLPEAMYRERLWRAALAAGAPLPPFDVSAQPWLPRSWIFLLSFRYVCAVPNRATPLMLHRASPC